MGLLLQDLERSDMSTYAKGDNSSYRPFYSKKLLCHFQNALMLLQQQYIRSEEKKMLSALQQKEWKVQVWNYVSTMIDNSESTWVYNRDNWSHASISSWFGRRFRQGFRNTGVLLIFEIRGGKGAQHVPVHQIPVLGTLVFVIILRPMRWDNKKRL